jgi:hypothetical protein
MSKEDNIEYITRTKAKKEYFLKDSDFNSDLKYIEKKYYCPRFKY